MGFKHAMLQRSYDLSPSPARTSPTHNGVQNLGAGPQIQPVQVTDFSISKILGKDRKPAQDTSTSILDLSKSSSLSVRSPPAGGNVTGPGTGLSMPTPYGGYSMLPPDLVAMANATKFYAQFFPHLLPAYAAAAAAAGLSTPPTSPYQQHHHQQTLPNQQKRFFAPYVINGQTQAPQQPLNRPKSTACTRPDCLECLDYYQRLQAGGGYKQTTPLISPAASSISSSSGSVRPVRDLIMSAAGGAAAGTNISLTTVTNLSLSSVQTAAVGMMPKLAGGGLVTTAVGSNSGGMGGIAGYNPTSPEEISYKCRICEKVFGCSETLQVRFLF